jgi:hypothetical protein
MKKVFLVGLAILAVSTSGALAKKATKPKPAAAAATTATTTPLMFQVSAADKELYKKNQRDSGIKAK